MVVAFLELAEAGTADFYIFIPILQQTMFKTSFTVRLQCGEH